jgi:hypothetical protein
MRQNRREAGKVETETRSSGRASTGDMRAQITQPPESSGGLGT